MKSDIPLLRGTNLLDSPALNKGTAFTDEERTRLGLHGLLPPYIETLEGQVARRWEAYRACSDNLARHINLRALQDTNEVLFYRLLFEHIEETMPVVYTPTVAEACRKFSHIYRRPRGLFISYPLRQSIRELLRNRPYREVDVIVVTDGERILGIGDQGVGGMGIPIGKLSLYTLIGGIHPTRTLPILLDVGTNNEERLQDPEYLGWHHRRIQGDAYFEFIDQFVEAVKEELPGTLIQWEDFAAPHARPILERYRNQLLTFNDDIQGTAAVVLGALMGAVKVAGGRLSDQQIVFLGAGSASTGVADYLRATMVSEGLSEEEARGHFWMVNRHGILHSGRADLTPAQRIYAQPAERVAGWAAGGVIGLPEVIANVRATALIGLSTQGSAFTEPIVREMAAKVERPIIFPLSNPTDRAEAHPADLIEWTEGRALVACGSPFSPVKYGGRTIPIAQCNNVYIFPAIGLAVAASGAKRVTDCMMLAGARALAEHSPALRDPTAPLLPALRDLREIAIEIAVEAALEADPGPGRERMREMVRARRWEPAYS
jgi:malate dehydrogenase (oxaloacetate-decarboxylating)